MKKNNVLEFAGLDAISPSLTDLSESCASS